MSCLAHSVGVLSECKVTPSISRSGKGEFNTVGLNTSH